MFLFKRKNKPRIVPREKHTLSRRKIDPDAIKVLYRLVSLNYEGYLVGGSVRDLLLGRTPKDFDVGTDARPNDIRRHFRNCFLVGRRFRLAHIVYGKKVIETATFRKAPDPNAVADEHGLYQSEDNNYGTPEEDALRRDFTINGLFYDIKTFSIIDYVGGLKDLEAKVVRSIGDPAIRFREDPVRMMRAVRFAAKLDFEIAPNDIKAIKRYAHEIANASISRLGEEVQRLCVRGATERSIHLAYDYGLLEELLPVFTAWLKHSPRHQETMWQTLKTLDEVSKTYETTTAVAFAALYYPLLTEALAETTYRARGKRGNERYHVRSLSEKILQTVVKKYRLPRAVWMTAVDILELSLRFQSAPENGLARDVRFATHPIFNEVFMGAEIFSRLNPEKKWHLSAWRNFALRLQAAKRRAEEGEEGTASETEETVDEAALLAPQPRRPNRRRPRRRRKPKKEISN